MKTFENILSEFLVKWSLCLYIELFKTFKLSQCKKCHLQSLGDWHGHTKIRRIFLKVIFILSNTTYFHWPLRNLIFIYNEYVCASGNVRMTRGKACERPDKTPRRLIRRASPTCNLNSPVKKLTTSHTEGICWRDLFERIRSSFKNK